MMLEAEFLSAEKLGRHMKPEESWRGGIRLRHRSSIFSNEFMRLAKQRADILVTHEGLGGAIHGKPPLNFLAKAIGVSLIVHGHLHKDIEYLIEGRLPVRRLGRQQGLAHALASASFRVRRRTSFQQSQELS